MQRIYVFLIFLFASIVCKAQCPDTTLFFFYDSPLYGGFGFGPVHATLLTTQEDIDSFAARYPNCTQVSSLWVGDPNNETNITSLHGLSQILTVNANTILVNTKVDSASVTGRSLMIVGNDSLRYLQVRQDGKKIENFRLYDNPLLEHLPNPTTDLSEIGGVSLKGNYALRNLAGLDSVTSMILFASEGNHSLTNLHGFENLDSVTGSFDIQDNDSLLSFDGIDNLRTTARLLVRNNPRLKSLSALSSLAEIRGDLDFWRNASLPSLQGLENLKYIGDEVDIYLTHLLSLDGLQGLEFVGGDFSIRSNDELMTLNGVNNLDTVRGLLEITNNQVLSTCNLSSMCALIQQGIQTNIVGNKGEFEDGNRVYAVCGLGGNCPYDFIATRQSDIDSFPIKYPSCSSIINNLDINGLFNSIEYLDSLTGIMDVGGNLVIKNTEVRDLTGLDSLDFVRGNMTMRSNRNLQNLVGLEKLDTIEGRLDISYNRAMRTLSGIDALRYAQSIDVDGNDSLFTLNGLGNLRSIESWVGIARNDRLSLCNTPTFCHLIPLASSTFIYDNPSPCSSAAEILDLCNCVSLRSITTGNGLYEASAEIRISDDVNVTTTSLLNAPLITIESNFSVLPGATLMTMSEGCDN